MATANSSIKPLVRYPINISIDVEDLESDEDIPRSLKGSNNVKSRLVEPNLAEPSINLASQLDTRIETVGVYIDTHPHKEKKYIKKWNKQPSNRIGTPETCNIVKTLADKAMEKSVLQPGFEKLECVPDHNESKRKQKLERKKEAQKTKGDKWFNLPATEMTEEKQRDLEIIQMRSILNPKQFYKKNDMKVVPKYFQVGTVIDSPVDFYHDRIPRKERKKTLVDELMANADFQRYNKKKYADIIQGKVSTSTKKRKH